MNKTKAKKTAKDWFQPVTMYCVFDCCDSMHDAEDLESRFNAYVDDTIDIHEYVRKNLRKEYVKFLVDFLNNEKIEITELEDTPSELPIPYKEIEKELKDLLNQPF